VVHEPVYCSTVMDISPYSARAYISRHDIRLYIKLQQYIYLHFYLQKTVADIMTIRLLCCALQLGRCGVVFHTSASGHGS